MEQRPPQGFVTLEAASHQLDCFVNVIGVLVKTQQPIPSRGSDYTVSFVLRDCSSDWSTGEGLHVRFFNKVEGNLPKVTNIGDVVVVRRARMKNYHGLTTALSHHRTECLLFPSHSIPVKEFHFQYTGKKTMNFLAIPGSAAPTVEEQQYAILLHDSLKTGIPVPEQTATVQSLSRPSTTSNSGPVLRVSSSTNHSNQTGTAASTFYDHKFRLIKDLQAETFVTLVGEVVKKFPNEHGYLEVYLTDYTSNPLLFNEPSPEEETDICGERQDGDNFGYASTGKKSRWTGPYGTMTIQVELHEPHAHWTHNNVVDGDVIVLSNVRAKISSNGKLAGNLWEDKKYTEKILVSKTFAGDPRNQDLLKRKKDYWSSRKAAHEIVDSKADAAEPAKSKKKKRKPKNKKAGRKEDETKPEQDFISAMAEVRVQSNHHVICAHRDIPITTIPLILDNPNRNLTTKSGTSIKLPFVNMKCRARVRVVDFVPQQLEDFSMPRNKQKTQTDNAPSGWQWFFYLIVEDARALIGPSATAHAPTLMKLLVGGEFAEFLLKLDATDLRRDAETLAKLREKLFIVWGELEEQYAAGINYSEIKKGPPFDTCIMEYGVPQADGSYERVFRMWGTTIQ